VPKVRADTPGVRTLLLTIAILLASASSAYAMDGISSTALNKSLALAEQKWHPANCPGVMLKPYNQADAELQDAESALGFALEDQCTIEVNLPEVKSYADSDPYVLDVTRTRQIWSCTVIVHEVGHLAGYLDPVGAIIVDAEGNPVTDDFTGEPLRDPRHSPNPRSVMYPYLRTTYAPCRKLFKATKTAGHLTPDAATKKRRRQG
jgi:hypothetical protein